jgi:glycine/D-amino acid oxidase-like deaminating enzyme
VAERPAEVIVLGAGLAGCALAYHLAEREVGPTTVVDPRTPAAGATGRAAGVVTEQLWNAWDVAVVRESHAEYAELCRQHDPTAHRRNGFVRWTHRREAAEVLRAAHDRLADWGVRAELIDAEGLSRRLPEARFDAGALGLFSERDGCVDPTALTGIYAERARRAGARFELGAPIASIARAGDRWTVATAAGSWSSRRLVIAAGAWSKALSARLGAPLPLAPYRTQAAVLRPRLPARPEAPTGHDLDTDVYVRPESNGRLLAGDGTELVEVDPDRVPSGGDERFLLHLAETLGRRWPAWGDAEVAASWSGVCAATPDRRPLVGAIAPDRELYALCGFNGFGVMRAGGAARRLAVLLGGADGATEGEELLRPVAPTRFQGTPRPFPPRPGFTLEGGDDPRF